MEFLTELFIKTDLAISSFSSVAITVTLVTFCIMGIVFFIMWLYAINHGKTEKVFKSIFKNSFIWFKDEIKKVFYDFFLLKR